MKQSGLSLEPVPIAARGKVCAGSKLKEEEVKIARHEGAHTAHSRGGRIFKLLYDKKLNVPISLRICPAFYKLINNF